MTCFCIITLTVVPQKNVYPLVSSSHPLLLPPVEDHCGQSFLEEGEQNKCTEKMLQKQKPNRVEIHCVDLHEYQIQQLG